MGGLIGFIILVLDIVAILDIFKGDLKTGKKCLWIFLILLVPAAGVVTYFFFGRKKQQA